MTIRSGSLVVSFVAKSLDDLESALALIVAGGDADAVEVRLDHIAGDVAQDPERLRRMFLYAELPFIAALHGAEGFGAFEGSVLERAQALRAAEHAGASYVDIDLRFADEIAPLVEGPRIFSTHHAVPSRKGLVRNTQFLDERVDEKRGDLVKIVPACETAAEGLAVLDWLASRWSGSTIAFGSGEAASFTRLAALAFGSPMVFARPGLDESQGLLRAAPGQLTAAHTRRVWAAGVPDRNTSLAAVCGQPIGHSASPVVHAAAARVLGIRALFVPVAPEKLDDLWAFPSVADRLAGLSVTAPFKTDAFEVAGGRFEGEAQAGAANTLVRSGDGRWTGANTDEAGVIAAFSHAGAVFDGQLAVVVGAGGAARAAANALATAGARVVVGARDGAKAEALAADLVRRGVDGIRGLALADPEFRGLCPSLVVHATPVGTTASKDSSSPVPDEFLVPGVIVLDAVYSPRRTDLLIRAEERGAAAAYGLDWFLEQAWRQHTLIFAAEITDQFGAAGIPAAVAAAARMAMTGALNDWLGLASPALRPVLALVGLRASGKSSVGAQLAQRIGARFVDLDQVVSGLADQPSAAAVIEAQGIEAFRWLETKALREMFDGASAAFDRGEGATVIATGGGVVESVLARTLLRTRTHCVWLRVDPDVAKSRASADEVGAHGVLRPALLPDGDTRDEYVVMDARRSRWYAEAARFVVDVGDGSVDDVAEQVEVAASEVVSRWSQSSR